MQSEIICIYTKQDIKMTDILTSTEKIIPKKGDILIGHHIRIRSLFLEDPLTAIYGEREYLFNLSIQTLNK